MKRKIYAISLLLSFLMAFSHEMIPHHHHEEFAYEFSRSHSHKQTHTHHDHHHHNEKGEHHEETQDGGEQHKHTFPHHHHTLASHGFDFTKRTINGSSLLKYHTLPFLSFGNILGLLIKPPDKELSNYADGPFPIISLFEPGATGLRAPPSIACLTPVYRQVEHRQA